MKKFNLIEETGSGDARQVRLSDLAVRIILDERPDSVERNGLIQRAALTPPIHAELWQQYAPALPSDANLLFRLQAEKGFTASGAQEFLREFKDTIAFAKLADGGSLSEEIGDTEGDDEEEEVPDPAAQRRRNRMGAHRSGATGMTVLSFQISDRLVEVSVPGGPLTKDEIGILKAYLQIQEKVAPDVRDEAPAADGEA